MAPRDCDDKVIDEIIAEADVSKDSDIDFEDEKCKRALILIVMDYIATKSIALYVSTKQVINKIINWIRSNKLLKFLFNFLVDVILEKAMDAAGFIPSEHKLTCSFTKSIIRFFTHEAKLAIEC